MQYAHPKVFDRGAVSNKKNSEVVKWAVSLDKHLKEFTLGELLFGKRLNLGRRLCLKIGKEDMWYSDALRSAPTFHRT